MTLRRASSIAAMSLVVVMCMQRAPLSIVQDLLCCVLVGYLFGEATVER